MRWKSILERVQESRAFGRAKEAAGEYARDPGKLDRLVEEAAGKARLHGRGHLAAVLESVGVALRLLRSYARGEYRRLPWQSLLLIVASVLYFVTPLDLMPDFLLGAGFLDDAALLAWALKAVKSELDRFSTWERGGGPTS
jgi:uncharacterized membrane protein YkvA (DUF1232 family)